MNRLGLTRRLQLAMPRIEAGEFHEQRETVMYKK
jgi:hypothetical protein